MKDTPEERRNLMDRIADLLNSKNMHKLALMVPVVFIVLSVLSPFVLSGLSTPVANGIYTIWTVAYATLLISIITFIFAAICWGIYRFIKW